MAGKGILKERQSATAPGRAHAADSPWQKREEEPERTGGGGAGSEGAGRASWRAVSLPAPAQGPPHPDQVTALAAERHQSARNTCMEALSKLHHANNI